MALTAEAQRILLVMDHSLDVVELLGGGGIIKGVSSAITALGGYHPGELIGRHYQKLIHPDDCGAAAAAFTDLRRHERVGPLTLRYRHKEGSWRTVVITARNLTKDPDIKAIVVLTRDVTEQVAAERSLDVANEELRRLARQLMVAHESERNHISRELHDDVQQILVGLRMTMESARGAHQESTGAVPLDSWVALTQEAIDHLHELTMTLRQPVLGKRGLPTELRAYLNRLSTTTGQDITLDIDPLLGPVPGEVSLACFRIVQEALTNAIKHSGAKNLGVRLQRTARALRIAISDDGAGFDTARIPPLAIEQGRIGLLSMRERAALAGGTLDIRSSASGGTCISATFNSFEGPEPLTTA